MLSERLQILVTPEQRRTLEAEAERQGTSVGAVVREAIDARLDTVDRARRRAAFEELLRISERNRGARRVSGDDLSRLIDESRLAEALRSFAP